MFLQYVNEAENKYTSFVRYLQNIHKFKELFPLHKKKDVRNSTGNIWPLNKVRA
jgi:uncharacterized protein YfbU (UPF0304 family)